MDSTLLVGLAHGMRHGTDPDHLTFVDRLCRLCWQFTNGPYFALGHALIIILLVVGIWSGIAGRPEFLRPSLMIAIGMVTLWKMRRPSPVQPMLGRSLVAQPLLLGMMLAVGSGAASQLPALAVQTDPLLLGAVFSGWMTLSDGGEGLFAASAQSREARGALNSQAASRALGYLVVSFSFALGGVELLGCKGSRSALPFGSILLALAIAFPIWARSRARISAPLASIIGVGNPNEGTL